MPVVGFPGNQFNGELIPEPKRLIEAGPVMVVDGLAESLQLNSSAVILVFEPA